MTMASKSGLFLKALSLVDNLHMGLWILKDGKWKCLLAGRRVDKTMGGARPHMPVLYIANGGFAFSETVPAA